MFYFDVKCGETIVEDPDGDDLPDLTAAEQLALEHARDVVIERIRNNRPIGSDAIIVRDTNSSVVRYVPLIEVVR